MLQRLVKFWLNCSRMYMYWTKVPVVILEMTKRILPPRQNFKPLPIAGWSEINNDKIHSTVVSTIIFFLPEKKTVSPEEITSGISQTFQISLRWRNCNQCELEFCVRIFVSNIDLKVTQKLLDSEILMFENLSWFQLKEGYLTTREFQSFQWLTWSIQVK